MEFLPIKTRIMHPPQDDLFAVLDKSLSSLQEKDVILISSKVVAIHQGRCIPFGEVEKSELISQEAEHLIYADYRDTPLTIKYNTFLGAAGIDESNGDGHYVLLPEKVFDTACEIHSYLTKRDGIRQLGVVITDSRSQPFRFGATGVALAFWGIVPVKNHAGSEDLFGREMKFEQSNIVDGLAAGANLVSGEVSECQPIVIARGVPDLIFQDKNLKDKLMVSPEEDMFRVLYKNFL